MRWLLPVTDRRLSIISIVEGSSIVVRTKPSRHAARLEAAKDRWTGSVAANQVRRSSQGGTRGGVDVVTRGKGHDEKLQARGERPRRKAGRLSRICQCRQGTWRVLGDRE